MDKHVQKTLIIVSGIVLVCLIAFGFTASLFRTKTTISSNGISELKVIPDLVRVYFNIETKADNISDANDKNSEIFNNLHDKLITAGFEEGKIQTTNLRVDANYVWDNGKQSIDGYVAQHSVVVEMESDNMGLLEKVIDAGISSGAGISYINFELSSSKEQDYKQQALGLAAEDARSKAKSIAEGAGQRIGNLVSISDSGFSYSPWIAYASADAGVSSPEAIRETTAQITPSEQIVSASVTAVYRVR